MATGNYAFRDIRLAVEGTPGTKENTADQRLLGTLQVPMGGPVLHMPLEERGSLAPQRRTVVVGEDLPLTFEGDLLFDSVLYLLGMGIEAKTVKTSGSNPYSWDYIPQLSSTNTPAPCTFQFGDDLAVYDVAYCTARQLQFSGVTDETVKMKAEMFGQNWEVGAFAPALGDTGIDPASTEVGLANKTTLYIDTAQGTPGTTVKTATLLSFTWTLDTGFRPLKYGSANVYWDALVQNFPKISCTMRAAFNTTTAAEQVFHKAGTARLFQIKISGTGSDFLKLNFSGVYTSWNPLGNDDGLDVVEFTIESQYDSGLSTLFSVILSNSLATQV